MKAPSRIGGLVLSALLFGILVPNPPGWLTARSEPTAIGAPVAFEAPGSDAATPGPVPTQTPTPAGSGFSPANGFVPSHSISVARGDRIDALSIREANAPVVPSVVPTLAPVRFDLFVHRPPGAAPQQALRVLLVLHGMGGQGNAFAKPLVAAAERNQWLLIAPTIPYNSNYMDPVQVMQEDLVLGNELHTLLDELPVRLGVRLKPHALVLGFSRGAQLAHRFAFFHPEQVETVAAISAGSYTMPFAKRDDKVLSFPFGIGDLTERLGEQVNWDSFKRISFWIAVGGKDNRPADVARAFDPYCGRTRVERAKAFEGALHDLGIDAQLAIFPDADHEVSADMRDSALRFLTLDETADNWQN